MATAAPVAGGALPEAAASAVAPKPKKQFSMVKCTIQVLTGQLVVERPFLFLMAWCRVGSDLPGNHPLYLAPAMLGWRNVVTKVVASVIACLRSPKVVLPNTAKELWTRSRTLRLIMAAALILEIPTICWITYRIVQHRKDEHEVATGGVPAPTTMDSFKRAVLLQVKNIPINLIDMVIFKYLWSSSYVLSLSGNSSSGSGSGDIVGVPSAAGLLAFGKAGCLQHGYIRYLFGAMVENLFFKFTMRTVAQILYGVFIEQMKRRVSLTTRNKIPRTVQLAFNDSIGIPLVYYPTGLVASRYMTGQFSSYESYLHCSLVRLGGDHLKSDHLLPRELSSPSSVSDSESCAAEVRGFTAGGVPQTTGYGWTRYYEGMLIHSLLNATKVVFAMVLHTVVDKALGIKE